MTRLIPQSLMGRVGRYLCLACLISVTTAYADSHVSMTDHRKTYVSRGTFEDIRISLEYTITGRGIVINNIAHIGNMLARTAKDIGASTRIYEKAEAIEFCSAGLSRLTMEADRHNIVFCPYIIAVYTLPGENNRVYVSYRRPQLVGNEASRRSLADIERLLDEIIEESIL